MYELGTGVLNWNIEERLSDRYGAVILFATTDTEGPLVKLTGIQEHLHGSLVAVVKQARSSYHLGDLTHGIRPSTPKVGERIALGTGSVFLTDDGIGLRPDDGRDTLWLDIRALYRAHHQTVTLYFEESPSM